MGCAHVGPPRGPHFARGASSAPGRLGVRGPFKGIYGVYKGIEGSIGVYRVIEVYIGV